MTQSPSTTATKIVSKDLCLHYGSFQALYNIELEVPERQVTALIGPSGCGKSTFLRCLNRMNDTIDGVKITGKVLVDGEDIYGPGVDPVALRQSVGMVFQKPNPFPMSIFDNVAYGPRLHGVKAKAQLEEIVEACLRDAALWDEVKDKLKASGTSLSGGQQQRLCIARSLAVNPEVILMDEPCSALDPIATAKIEELMAKLKERFTIVIVTHNMQQAQRAADRTAFFMLGKLIEENATIELFTNPREQQTEDYISGRFG